MNRWKVIAVLLLVLSPFSVAHEKKEKGERLYHVDGVTYFPLVVILTVVKEHDELDDNFLEVVPNMVSARWSEKPKGIEVLRNRELVLIRELGKPVKFGKTQTATVWVKARFGGTNLSRSYGVSGDLILEMNGKVFYKRTVKEILKERYEGKLKAIATVVMIEASMDEVSGKKGILPRKKAKRKVMKKDEGVLLPLVE